MGGLGRFSSGISEMNGLTIQSNSGSALPGLSALAGNGTQFYDAAGANVVLVHDLPDQFTSQELLTAFAQFGKVVFCDLGDDHSGRVDYGSSRDANKAVATMNGLPVGEKKLNVRLVRSFYQTVWSTVGPPPPDRRPLLVPVGRLVIVTGSFIDKPVATCQKSALLRDL